LYVAWSENFQTSDFLSSAGSNLEKRTMYEAPINTGKQVDANPEKLGESRAATTQLAEMQSGSNLQAKFQALANGSSQVQRLMQLKALTKQSPARSVVQAMMATPVVQRVKVGGAGAGIMFLAASRFNAIFEVANTVLTEMRDAGTEFESVAAIEVAVRADARVIAALAAVAAAAAAAEAARVAAAEAAAAIEVLRQESDLVVDYGAGTQLRQYDIEHGVWERIPNRVNGDRQLRVTLRGVEYAYHVHPPAFAGRAGVAGQVMRGGRMTNTATPADVIVRILAHFGRPAGW
jgi:hypothetical protein